MKPGRYRKSLRKAWRRLQNRLLGGRRVLVIGDSHGGVFEYAFDHGLLAPHWLNCEIVPGATAYGLNNDASQTRGWEKFDRALRRFEHFDTVLVVLGECDCSYALWQIAAARGTAPAELLGRSLDGVRRLVGRIRDGEVGRGKRVVLVGAPLPTVDDAAAARQENLLRRDIAATQRQRTELVLQFNAGLRALAAALQTGYFELSDALLDPASGLVDRRFVACPEDHHLSHPATAPLWAAGLRGAL